MTKDALAAAVATIHALGAKAKWPWNGSYNRANGQIAESANGNPAFPQKGVPWRGAAPMHTNSVLAFLDAIDLERRAKTQIDADPIANPDSIAVACFWAGALFQLRDHVLETQS